MSDYDDYDFDDVIFEDDDDDDYDFDGYDDYEDYGDDDSWDSNSDDDDDFNYDESTDELDESDENSSKEKNKKDDDTNESTKKQTDTDSDASPSEHQGTKKADAKQDSGGRYDGKGSNPKSPLSKTTQGGEQGLDEMGKSLSKIGDKLGGGAGVPGGNAGNWFSKLTKGFKSGGGKAAGQAAGKAAGKAAGQAAGKTAGKAAANAGGGILKALAPYLPYILLALLIIILIIVIIVMIVSIISFLKQKSDPENMKTNPYVVNSYFYGIRTVYIDNEALVNSLELSYKQYVVDVFEDIETDNPSITISINLPEERFDNSTNIDAHITNMASGIANIVATGAGNYSNVDYTALYPQIEYFGLTAEQGDKTNDFITKYVNDNSLLTSSESIDVNAIIDTAMGKENLQYIYNRCEKVMIKDEIATSAGLVGMEERQYIASIYMPNSKIRIDSSIYTIASTSEKFNCSSKLIEVNNGTETIPREKETKDNADIISGFTFGNVIIDEFTNIDVNNTSAFSSGLSLFQAMSMSPDYVAYFTQNAETSIYTWMPTDASLFYLTFEASTKFIFTDFQLNVQLP